MQCTVCSGEWLGAVMSRQPVVSGVVSVQCAVCSGEWLGAVTSRQPVVSGVVSVQCAVYGVQWGHLSCAVLEDPNELVN